MAQVHLQISSFNAGELSPLLGSRFAVEKVASGCRRLRNFYLHVHGPAFRRPGMEYMGAAVSNAVKSRLEGFNFSTSTGFVLEFSPGELAVWSNSVRVPLQTPVDLPYSATECFELQMAQVNDVCYLAHPNHPPRKLVRHADDDWRLEEIAWTWPALGDENVRSSAIATPAITELLSIPTQQWPEGAVPAIVFTFEVDTPDTTAATKTVRLQYLVSGVWTDWHVFTWTTVGPMPWTNGALAARTIRLASTGPVGPGGSLAKVYFGGSLFCSLPLDAIQPRTMEDATMPAGEWQAIVDGGPTVPAGSQLWIQMLLNGAWTDIKQMPLRAGERTTYRSPALRAERHLRFDWRGRAMIGGTMSLEKLVYPPSDDITIAVDTVNGIDRAMTASEPIFKAGHIGSFWQIAHRRDEAFVQIEAAVPTISAESTAALRVSGQWNVFTYGIWDATFFLEQKIQGAWEVLRSWSSKKDRNVVASGTQDDEVEMRLRVSAGTSEAATGAAAPRFVLEADNARAYGLVKITAVGTLDSEGKTETATVDVLATLFSTDATPLWTEGAWSQVNGYPRGVALHGQRLWFGGTLKEPQRLWGSAASDYENFRRTSLDDASVSFTPAAQQANSIQWLATHEHELVIGTSGDEWTLAPADGGFVTPVNAQMQRRSAYGSAYQPPILLGEGLIFIQRGARKLRQILAHTDSVAWSATDLTVLSEHVTRTGVAQMAAMTFPLTILWAVTAEGNLLGMTFETDQNVFGWHVHETDGLVESVAVVHGPLSDEVWVAVLRGTKRSIERLDPLVFAQRFDEPERLIYVDAAARIESADLLDAVTTGLDHLEGQTVAIVGDGAELASQVVTGGAVALSEPAGTIIVGLPFTSELQPMRMDVPLKDGTAQGRLFRVSRAMVSLYESLGGEVADAPDKRFEKLRVNGPALFSGDTETPIESSARSGADVTVRQTGPLPLNVLAIVLKMDVYGD